MIKPFNVETERTRLITKTYAVSRFFKLLDKRLINLCQ